MKTARLIFVFLCGIIGTVYAQKIKVMPLGNSITEGYVLPGAYRSQLWRDLDSAGLTSCIDLVGTLNNNATTDLGDIDHEGHSGWRIDEIAGGINDWMDATTPDIVMLEIGTNDLAQDYQEATAPARLGSLVDQICAKLPVGGKVYVASITPFGGIDNPEVVTFNNAIPAMVQTKFNAGKPVYFVDAYAALYSATNQMTYLSNDWTHPNQDGYNKLGHCWFSAIKNDVENICEKFTLTTNTTSGGVLTRMPDKNEYYEGQDVTLIANPNSGYRFLNWSGNATGIVNPLEVNMTSDKTITATFTTGTTYSLTTTAVNGSVTKNPNLNGYNNGDVVVLTAIPNIGFKFSSWSGSYTGTSNPANATINGNMNVTANFETADDIIIYTDADSAITFIWVGNGDLSQQTGTGAYEGTKHLFFDYTIDDWWAAAQIGFNTVDLSTYNNLVIATKGPSVQNHICGIILLDNNENEGPQIDLATTSTYTVKTIPLSSLINEDVDIYHISKIYIGLSGEGVQYGAGTLYIDNIAFTVNPISDLPQNYATGSMSNNIRIYPNPVFSSNLLINVSGMTMGNTDVLLTDLQGRTVYRSRLNVSGASAELQFGNLSKGLYILKIINNNHIFCQKLVIN